MSVSVMGSRGENLWFGTNSYNGRFWSLFLFRSGSTLAGILLAVSKNNEVPGGPVSHRTH
ncbi:hypothetical protein RQM65_08735 [Pricia sp. S334]|uniref:Uncharacterized protein n=1 Tax=Pricia mediterranea TaxID=3076079 RepID=A0ABU3L4S5_9FLAO|nr:hypothetical protein [Pricia sp. S334]MDT7828746.1 hypothetical protein [Pricia sp. S334]